VTPDLDYWLPSPGLRIVHARETHADADDLWAAARSVQLADSGLLGRLIRWHIPGTQLAITFDELFRSAPFLVLDDRERGLVSGLVGRIWALRRDYQRLSDPNEFRAWSTRGTARVLFANWVDGDTGDGSARLISEARVDAIGARGRAGLVAVRPLVRTFHHLIASDGIAVAVRRAERGS
jgi:hypothetical protein